MNLLSNSSFSPEDPSTDVPRKRQRSFERPKRSISCDIEANIPKESPFSSSSGDEDIDFGQQLEQNLANKQLVNKNNKLRRKLQDLRVDIDVKQRKLEDREKALELKDQHLMKLEDSLNIKLKDLTKITDTDREQSRQERADIRNEIKQMNLKFSDKFDQIQTLLERIYNK